LQKEFNAELYRWEQHYFFENCVGRFFEVPEERWAWFYDAPGMIHLADRLAAMPRVLVHRDFQSQNIMVLNGKIGLIDFQGMRPGLAQYDLASLLYDPYTDLTGTEREHLLQYYIELVQSDTDIDEKAFQTVYYETAAQRLMQALGAYGFLGLTKNRPRFLDFIPIALERLEEVIDRVPGSPLTNLGNLVKELRAR